LTSSSVSRQNREKRLFWSAFDILHQLLTTCESREVVLGKYSIADCFPVSGLAAFSHFLVHSRNLKVLRAIDALTRTDLQIELSSCKPTELGEEILLECIRQNRGPTELSHCWIDTRLLADPL
jgi:hypothetical protein